MGIFEVLFYVVTVVVGASLGACLVAWAYGLLRGDSDEYWREKKRLREARRRRGDD